MDVTSHVTSYNQNAIFQHCFANIFFDIGFWSTNTLTSLVT